MLAYLEFPCLWIDSGTASTTTSGHAYWGVKQPGKQMGHAHVADVMGDSYSFAATAGSGDGDYSALSPLMGGPRSSFCRDDDAV